MRQVVLYIFIIAELNVVAQNFKTDSLGRFTFTDTVTTDSIRIEKTYEWANKWFVMNFKQPRGIIVSQNDSSWEIKATGRIRVHYRTIYVIFAGLVYYDMHFKALENGYWFELTNLTHHKGQDKNIGTGGNLENKLPACGVRQMNEEIWHQIKVDSYLKFKKMTLEFKEEMTTAPKIHEEFQW